MRGSRTTTGGAGGRIQLATEQRFTSLTVNVDACELNRHRGGPSGTCVCVPGYHTLETDPTFCVACEKGKYRDSNVVNDVSLQVC